MSETRACVRRLWRDRTFALGSIAFIGVAVGIALFTITLFRGILSRDLPGADADGLVALEWRTGRRAQRALSFQEFETLRASTRGTFEGVAATVQETVGVSVTGHLRVASIERISEQYFRLLDVRIVEGIASVGEEPTVVLSGGLRRRLFGDKETVVGKVVTVNGSAHVVSGVADPLFRGLYAPTLGKIDAWVPLTSRDELAARRGNKPLRLRVFGRPTINAAGDITAAVATLSVQLRSFADAPTDERFKLVAVPLEEALAPREALAVGTSIGAVVVGLATSIVLLACANLAGLMVARSVARRGEFRVRVSLGARPKDIARLVISEAAILVVLAFAAALLLLSVLQHFAPSLTWNVGGTFLLAPLTKSDWSLFAGALVLCVLAIAVIGMSPALLAMRASGSSDGLAISSLAMQGLAHRTRARLVRWQLSTATVLLILGAVFIKGALGYAFHDFGFDVRSSALLESDLRLAGYSDERGRQAFAALLAAAGRIPDATHVALVDRPMIGPENNPASFEIEGSTATMFGSYARISPTFFEAVRLKLTSGRPFTDFDDAGSKRVVIVNETAAMKLSAAIGTVLGSRIAIRPGDSPREVVGIARDTDVRRPGTRLPFVFVPWRQDYSPRMSLLVVGRTSPEDLIRPAQAVFAAVAPDAPLLRATTLADAVSTQQMPVRVAAIALGALGFAGIFLAMLGTHASLSYMAAIRRREFGIRSALGATTSDLFRLVFTEGSRLVMPGVIAGAMVGLVLVVVGQSFSRFIGLPDFALLAIATTVVSVAALLSTCGAALRTSRINPARVLSDYP